MSERLIPILEDLTNKRNVFFSDQSNFYVSGMMNKRNCRIWAAKQSIYYRRGYNELTQDQCMVYNVKQADNWSLFF